MRRGGGANVGFRLLSASDGEGDPVAVRLLYPTRAEASAVRLGPYEMEIAADAPVEGERLPVAVVSHGTGSSALTHRLLGAHLAKAGFVVALVEHPRNNREDNSLANTAAILENRPRQVSRVLDALADDPELGPRLAGSAGVIGHSLGGYTALAAAGGKPTAFGRETEDGLARPVPVVPDARVKALVLLAPATPWYMGEGSLAEVRAPILMFTGERDAHAPPGFAEIVKTRIGDPALVDHRVVPGAGHFSFQSPFPPAMRRPDFAPSQDPPGFDREAFLATLYPKIEAFLVDKLAVRTG